MLPSGGEDAGTAAYGDIAAVARNVAFQDAMQKEAGDAGAAEGHETEEQQVEVLANLANNDLMNEMWSKNCVDDIGFDTAKIYATSTSVTLRS